jgi:hypothetical protein
VNVRPHGVSLPDVSVGNRSPSMRPSEPWLETPGTHLRSFRGSSALNHAPHGSSLSTTPSSPAAERYRFVRAPAVCVVFQPGKGRCRPPVHSQFPIGERRTVRSLRVVCCTIRGVFAGSAPCRYTHTCVIRSAGSATLIVDDVRTAVSHPPVPDTGTESRPRQKRDGAMRQRTKHPRLTRRRSSLLRRRGRSRGPDRSAIRPSRDQPLVVIKSFSYSVCRCFESGVNRAESNGFQWSRVIHG